MSAIAREASDGGYNESMTSTGGAPLSSELPFTSAPTRLERPTSLLQQAGQRHVAVLVLLFLLSIPAITPRIYASDEVQYFAFLRSIWFDRDVSFDNEYRHFYDAGVARSDGFRETLLEMQSETGLRISFATVGSAILWAPFYAVADAGVLMARAAGAAVPRDGYSWPYLAAVCYGSAFYGFLAVLLGVRLATAFGCRSAAQPDCGHRRLARDPPHLLYPRRPGLRSCHLRVLRRPLSDGLAQGQDRLVGRQAAPGSRQPGR